MLAAKIRLFYVIVALMKRNGDFVEPSKREFETAGIGCFKVDEAYMVAAALYARSEQMFRAITPGDGDMRAFNDAADIGRLAFEIGRRFVPGFGDGAVDLSPDSAVFDQQRASGNLLSDDSFITDEDLRSFLGHE